MIKHIAATIAAAILAGSLLFAHPASAARHFACTVTETGSGPYQFTVNGSGVRPNSPIEVWINDTPDFGFQNNFYFITATKAGTFSQAFLPVADYTHAASYPPVVEFEVEQSKQAGAYTFLGVCDWTPPGP